MTTHVVRRVALSSVVLAVSIGWFAGLGQGAPRQPLDMQLAVEPTGTHLERELTIFLLDRATGDPVVGARVLVGADMVTMPMMHDVEHVHVMPGDVPGQYKARIRFEMPGEWVVTVAVTGARSARFTRKIQVDGRQKGDRR